MCSFVGLGEIARGVGCAGRPGNISKRGASRSGFLPLISHCARASRRDFEGRRSSLRYRGINRLRRERDVGCGDCALSRARRGRLRQAAKLQEDSINGGAILALANPNGINTRIDDSVIGRDLPGGPAIDSLRLSIPVPTLGRATCSRIFYQVKIDDGCVVWWVNLADNAIPVRARSAITLFEFEDLRIDGVASTVPTGKTKESRYVPGVLIKTL